MKGIRILSIFVIVIGLPHLFGTESADDGLWQGRKSLRTSIFSCLEHIPQFYKLKTMGITQRETVYNKAHFWAATYLFLEVVHEIIRSYLLKDSPRTSLILELPSYYALTKALDYLELFSKEQSQDSLRAKIPMGILLTKGIVKIASTLHTMGFENKACSCKKFNNPRIEDSLSQTLLLYGLVYFTFPELKRNVFKDANP